MKFAHRFQNYRKAKNNEICCKDCKKSNPPKFWGKRLRCGDDLSQYNISQAIGKNMTCDAAEIKDKIE